MPTEVTTMAIRGSCLCGGVRFEIDRACGPAEFCHCNRCRKLSARFAAYNSREHEGLSTPHGARIGKDVRRADPLLTARLSMLFLL